MTAHPASRTLRSLAAVGILCLTAVGLTAPESVAKSPHIVDPATLQPALNPDFAPWSCFQAGSGITCQGSYEASYVEQVVQCDGRTVEVAGTIRERMTRWHTADGLATKTVVHLDAPGDVFSIEGSSKTVTVRGHWNRHYTYPVPGDRESRVLTETGAFFLTNVPGEGSVFLDVGLTRFAPGAEFEEIAVSHGVHDFYDDPSAFERVLCDVLA